MVAKYVEMNSTSSAAASTSKINRKSKKTGDAIQSQRVSHARGGSQIRDEHHFYEDTDYACGNSDHNAVFSQTDIEKTTPVLK